MRAVHGGPLTGRGWAVICDGPLRIMMHTVRQTRRESIRALVGPEAGVSRRWQYWRRRGCSCERVETLALTPS